MKRVFMIHGWGGRPDEGWFLTVKSALENKGYVVIAPTMPDTEEPDVNKWVTTLAELVDQADKDTHFIGHSIGSQTIMRFIQDCNTQVGTVVFTGGWFHLKGLDEESLAIAKPWLESSIDTDRVKELTQSIKAIFSDDDPWVPTSEEQLFKERLAANTVMLHKKGHFESMRDFPEITDTFD